MTPYRRKKDLVASRRRVADEGDEEGGPDAGDIEDDSLSEGSVVTEEDEGQDGDEISPDTLIPAHASEPSKAKQNGPKQIPGKKSNGVPKKSSTNGTKDMDMMLNGLKLSDQSEIVEEVHFEDLREDTDLEPSPMVVDSSAQMDRPQEAPYERRRREHEEYKKKRDADPAFVPNRGAFFMHDHRHAGPAANGFRPFGRGRGRGRPGIGGPYAPFNQMPQPSESTDAPWAHDKHEIHNEPQQPRNLPPANFIRSGSAAAARLPVNASKTTPVNRALSTTKLLGKAQIRVFFLGIEKPIVFQGVPVQQYTRLPDHRPPLRRDKPVRISLPDHPPRYIFPAVDRSFIFIPRAMRPNQQGFGGRGRGRGSAFGSVGGYSRQTSIFGGSVYGSTYTPSIAMSRRSSLAREVNRDGLASPSASMSRSQAPIDSSVPIVKLPPSFATHQPVAVNDENKPHDSISGDEVQHPQTHPPPQNPTFRENRHSAIPMHQPRPQKTVSVAGIESPAAMSFNPPQQHQQPFYHQVPVQVNGNGFTNENMLHTRNASYPSQASTGTPLSQIPERAIHAQPFQPNLYQQPQPPPNYYPQAQSYPQPLLPPPPGYYYPPQTFNQSGGAPPFIPSQPQQQQQQPLPLPQTAQQEDAATQNLVAQEVNGMVYYYDATQIPAVATYPAYQPPPQYPMQQVSDPTGMGGMMTPSPHGFYYPPAVQSAVYYPQ